MPYWHAEELLSDDRGVLVPFGNSDVLAREVVALLRDETRRHAMRRRAYMHGRNAVWSKTARLYLESFEKRESGHRTPCTAALDCAC